ncbi:3-hydroxypropionyl-coenzyme A dehydratase [Geodia barretti]|uniref:3-hydroxypropionyl-coenzyme A dehydratase n=1 Tax=Geodia barretti TaxID=519541 RepID=A0AA35W0Z9_GEOBA|nr:3-hydroxypropionyl-coenzyme A dehydratase [Geodia barretti]
MTDYSSYQHLLIEKSDGIITLTMNRPETLNSTNFRLHNELSRIWLDIGADPEVRVAVVTGAGEAFSAGGDFEMIEQAIDNPAIVAQNTKEAGDIVYNILNLDKPVISAINGVAVGAGLAVALMADISIAAEDARITDGHIRLGAKYYLLTCDFLDGKEAERIGLVSMAVPRDELMETAMRVARRLADGPQPAIRFTKRALNQWLRQAGHTSFDYSLLAEALGFFGDDVKEAWPRCASDGGPNTRRRKTRDVGTFSCQIEVFSADGSPLLTRLGVEPRRRIQSELADGSIVEDAIGEARVSVEGVETTTIVVFVGEGAPTLLGAYTLEGALLMVDPIRQQLAPTHALRMANLIEFIDSEVPQH